MNAPEFKLQCGQSFNFPQFIQHSKSSGNIQQQIQFAVAARRRAVETANTLSNQILPSLEVLHPAGSTTDRVQTYVRICILNSNHKFEMTFAINYECQTHPSLTASNVTSARLRRK